jgi:poly-gamma-glutamate capsule biosynthesis protein CapA/YwtB (metallophosphatase superfamily)
MPARYGWELRSWFGQFVTVAASLLALALLTLGIAKLLVLRYEARVADGDIRAPALRMLDAGSPVYVLGARVGDVPEASHVATLEGALKKAVSDLPWQRVLVHRETGADGSGVTTLFFPVNGISEAFAICEKLSDIPPQCVPGAVALNELSAPDGTRASEALLARMGVAPYAEPRSRPKIAAQASPPAPARSEPARLFWLSSKYARGNAALTDVVAAGDVMMGSVGLGLNPQIREKADAASLVGPGLAGTFRRADVAFANLEGPLYDGPDKTPKDCGNCFAFHSPPYYASVLRSLGLDVVSLANNHSGDYGLAGRESTMAALRARDIAYAGLDREDARAATLVLKDGRKIAVTAFAPNSGTLNLNNIPAAAALIRSLKKTHDLVIVSFHGGAEGWDHVHVPKSEEYFYGEDRGNVEAFAHAAIDAGADLVIGQGPHVPRAVEIYRGHLITYSLGNFWTYEGVNSYAVSGLGPVLEAWLAPDGSIAGFMLHSTRQAGLGVPHLDPLDEAERYILYLTKSDFPGTASRLSGAGRAFAAREEGGEGRLLSGMGS